ncbi:Probable LRR receptor-like serine/threonine-protein kinase At3g47570 [Linum grandiflorum]
MSSGSLRGYTVVAVAFLVQLLCLCCCVSSSGVLLRNETDRLALLGFKSMITSDPFGVLSSWNDSIHFCEWYGVSCSRKHYGRVTALELHSQGLSGSISPHVGNLSFLKFLALSNNSLVGEIPSEIGRLGRLQKFGLSNNSFDGEIPSNISRCSALTWFNVSNNKLVGELPWQFGQLSKLQAFSVYANNIHGSIPPAFGNLSSLQYLRLYNNNLGGEIPSEIGRLGRLQVLDLSNNSFDGEIPSNISRCSALTWFNVGNNKLVGELPWQFGQLSKLQAFSVYANNIQGSIPPAFGNLSSLQMFYGDNNQLSGRVPATLGRLKSIQILSFQRNNLSGEMPSAIFNLSSLTEMWFGFNQLHGILPWNFGLLLPNLEVLDMGRNQFTGSVPPSLSNASNLVLLQLVVNNFTGSMPSMEFSTKLTWFSIWGNSLGNGKANDLSFLSFLTNATNLENLQIAQNNFGGSLPQDIGNLSTSLKFLSFVDNNIYGNIPSGIQSLVNLEVLGAYNNNLSGNIPSSLGGCISLETLALQGNHLQVPTKGAFENSSIISVIGNDKLCGGIAALKLPPCNFTIHSTKRLSLTWKIVISTISSLLFLAFIVSAFFILLVKKRGRRDAVSTDDKKLLQLSYQRLFKATDGFSSTNHIGVGSFGTVYKGVIDDISEISIKIAVKVFNLQRRGASKSFMAECEALKNIRHKNLVKIVTVCSSVDHEGNDFKALIYDFLANGSLEDWLHRPIERIDEPTTRRLNFIQRLNVAIDIASAVDYLHNNCGTPIAHCDLKPSNVLLDEDMVAHVGDFGLARFLLMVENPASSTIGIKGTVGYAPPEYGMGNEVSIQGDVYSYGILLLELFTGKRPTDETFRDGLSLHNVVMSALSEQRTFEVVDPVLLNELLRRLTAHHNNTSNSSEEARKVLEELMSSILDIGVSCSLDIPEERISMVEVSSRLTTVKKKVRPVERR